MRLVLALALAGFAGCSLYTDTASSSSSCSRHEDCFRHFGEGCDLSTHTCCPGCLPDAAPDAMVPPDATPLIVDAASAVDAGADAQP